MTDWEHEVAPAYGWRPVGLSCLTSGAMLSEDAGCRTSVELLAQSLGISLVWQMGAHLSAKVARCILRHTQTHGVAPPSGVALGLQPRVFVGVGCFSTSP